MVGRNRHFRHWECSIGSRPNKLQSMRRPLVRATKFLVVVVIGLFPEIAAAAVSTNSFVNFETPPVHPVALSPDGSRLAVCNLADSRMELFDLKSGLPVSLGSRVVGLD